MKKEYLPYYISRLVISAVFALLVFGFDWKALVFTAAIFCLFLLYLHSGWFNLDPSNPLFPIRRDDRGTQIQRKALLAAISCGILLFGFMQIITLPFVPPQVYGQLALALGIVIYFSTQFYLLAKT